MTKNTPATPEESISPHSLAPNAPEGSSTTQADISNHQDDINRLGQEDWANYYWAEHWDDLFGDVNFDAENALYESGPTPVTSAPSVPGTRIAEGAVTNQPSGVPVSSINITVRANTDLRINTTPVNDAQANEPSAFGRAVPLSQNASHNGPSTSRVRHVNDMIADDPNSIFNIDPIPVDHVQTIGLSTSRRAAQLSQNASNNGSSSSRVRQNNTTSGNANSPSNIQPTDVGNGAQSSNPSVSGRAAPAPQKAPNNGRPSSRVVQNSTTPATTISSANLNAATGNTVRVNNSSASNRIHQGSRRASNTASSSSSVAQNGMGSTINNTSNHMNVAAHSNVQFAMPTTVVPSIPPMPSNTAPLGSHPGQVNMHHNHPNLPLRMRNAVGHGLQPTNHSFANGPPTVHGRAPNTVQLNSNLGQITVHHTNAMTAFPINNTAGNTVHDTPSHAHHSAPNTAAQDFSVRPVSMNPQNVNATALINNTPGGHVVQFGHTLNHGRPFSVVASNMAPPSSGMHHSQMPHNGGIENMDFMGANGTQNTRQNALMEDGLYHRQMEQSRHVPSNQPVPAALNNENNMYHISNNGNVYVQNPSNVAGPSGLTPGAPAFQHNWAAAGIPQSEARQQLQAGNMFYPEPSGQHISQQVTQQWTQPVVPTSSMPPPVPRFNSGTLNPVHLSGNGQAPVRGTGHQSMDNPLASSQGNVRRRRAGGPGQPPINRTQSSNKPATPFIPKTRWPRKQIYTAQCAAGPSDNTTSAAVASRQSVSSQSSVNGSASSGKSSERLSRSYSERDEAGLGEERPAKRRILYDINEEGDVERTLSKGKQSKEKKPRGTKGKERMRED